MKEQRHAELPRFVAGALATAGASVANGATVQITFDNNVVSSGGATLNSDLTGDTTPDVSSRRFRSETAGFGYATVSTLVFGGAIGRAFFDSVEGIGSRKVGALNEPGSGVTRGLVAFSFTDSRMNGGQVTAGWLDVSASASSQNPVNASVRIHRLIFDDASTTAPTGVIYTDPAFPEFVAAVPEPGSNLALLALGAGGLTLRRRLKRAA